MSDIEPGTPVRVVIEGIATPMRPLGGQGEYLLVETVGDHSFDLWPETDPAVTVTPLDPERPTLTKATIAAAIDEANFQYDGYGGSWNDKLSEAIAALIQAAHPGLVS